MTLADIKKGERFNILQINDDKVRAQALRFGISEGASLICGEKIPGGPVIVKRNLQEIAVGRNLANNILVELGDL
ncbi:MAG: ferrous iron transport protein A [Halanaerobiales bacterium]